MWVAPDELGIDALQNITHEKVFVLSRNLGMQTDLQQQIAKFFTQVLAIFLVQGFQDLVRDRGAGSDGSVRGPRGSHHGGVSGR